MSEAAAALDLTVDAVRSRLKRGSLTAHRIGGHVFVVTDDLYAQLLSASHRRTVDLVADHRLPRPVPDQSPSAIVLAEALAPLLDRLEAQSRQIGRLEAENAELRARVAAAHNSTSQEGATSPERGQAVGSVAGAAQSPRFAPQAPWWAFWRWGRPSDAG